MGHGAAFALRESLFQCLESGLCLVSNAILVWNTLQIARILETLRQTGTPVAVEDLARVSPLLHRSIVM
jgi:Tn3 transposase DDE domain